MDLPVFTVDLIKLLDEMYPERCANLKDNEREIWYYAGQRSVVNLLLTRYKQQEDDSLVNALT